MNERLLADLVAFLMEQMEADPEEVVEWFVLDYGYPRDKVYGALTRTEEED